MGKKKKGAVCNNPVAMARASGPPPSTGPTIRDYLSRDRPSLEEATALLGCRRKESGALAAYEAGDQRNDHYKEELRRHREKVLGEASSSSGDKKKKKKKRKSGGRDRSRSRSPLPSSHYRRKSKRKHHRSRHYSSTESSSDSEEEGRKKTKTRASGEERTEAVAHV